MIIKKSLLGVRIDKIDTSLEEVLDGIRGKKNAVIITLNVLQFLKVKFNKELTSIVENADIVIPTHRALSKAYYFINKDKINHYKDFMFFSSILSYSEERKMSLFLFGSNEKYFFTITEKIKKIYPYIHIVGSYQETSNKETMTKAFTGFKKIAPDMFILYMDFKRSLLWYNKNKESLDLAFIVPVKRPLDAFAGKEKSPDISIIMKNKEWAFYLKHNIFTAFHSFYHILFWFLILMDKLFKFKKKK